MDMQTEAERNIHQELLPEGYRFTPEDEARLDNMDFYSPGGKLPGSETTEADRFMAWRYYGQFVSPMDHRWLASMAWRIGRERQLLASLAESSRLAGQVEMLRDALGLVIDCGFEYEESDEVFNRCPECRTEVPIGEDMKHTPECVFTTVRAALAQPSKGDSHAG